MAVICLSVVLSERPSPMPDPQSRIEGHRKLKIGSKEPHNMGDLWPHLEVER